MNMALTVLSKVTTRSQWYGPRRNCLIVSATVGFHGNHSTTAQRFIDACTRVGIPLRADLNTPRGTLGVAKVSGVSLRLALLILYQTSPIHLTAQ